MTAHDVADRVAKMESLVQQRVGARDAILYQRDSLVKDIDTLTFQLANTEKAIAVLQSYAADMQAMLSERIEDIVTSGLRAVFQNHSLVFKMEYAKAKDGNVKKQPDITMSVQYERAGVMVEGGLKDGFGGGLAVVAAVLLNVVVVLHMQPRLRPILLLDEPLAALSPASEGGGAVANGMRERLADFLQTLTAETDVQLVIVTHEPDFAAVADVAYHFRGGIGEDPKVVRTDQNA